MTAAPDPLRAVAGDGASLRVGELRLRVHGLAGGLPPEIPDRTLLAREIEAALRDLVGDDDSYWVIRRVALPFRVEPRLGVVSLAEAFALALRRQVGRILRGEEIDGVRRYASRAHWLAECLWAQAREDAREQWQFRRYRHHGALPAAAAVRLTLLAEPGSALPALAMLAGDQRIRNFCKRLGEPGVRGVVAVLVASGPAPARQLDPALKRLLADEAAAVPGRRHSAMLAALARRAAAGMPFAIPHMASLRRELAAAAIDGRTTRAGIDPANDRDCAQSSVEAGRSAPHDDASPASPLSEGRSQGTTAAPLASAIETGFAGIFVLWRSACEMGLPDLLPQGEAGGPARLALATAMAGPEHRAAWRDPALHWLCGYRPEPDERAPPPPADLAARFLDRYRDMRGFRPIEPSLSAIGRASILQDRQSEDWLALGSRRLCLAGARRLDAEPTAPLPTSRDPAIDLDWFGVRHRRVRRAWVLLARAAYGDFARRLHGLEGSSAAWLWERLLAGWGTLEPGSPAVMHLPRAQLDLVLRMSALNGALLETPCGQVRLALPGAD